MKAFIILLLLVSLLHSFGNESIPQHKIDQAYEKHRRSPVGETELRELQSLSTSEIFDQVLKADQSPSAWRESRLRILEKRKEDLTLEIRKTLNESQLTIDALGKLAFLASLVSPDFEAEVASSILKHASASEYDIYFLDSETFRNHFRSNPGLLQSSLNNLLAEGRIEMHSATHQKWKDSIFKFQRIQHNQEKRDARNRHTSTRHVDADRQVTEHGDEGESPSGWLFVLGSLILMGIFAAIIKTWRGNT